MIGLDQLATVYIQDPNGDYTAPVYYNVPCRLTLVGIETTPESQHRVERASDRRLLWDIGTTLTELMQVQVNGTKWNLVKGTITQVRGANGLPYYNRAEVISTS